MHPAAASTAIRAEITATCGGRVLAVFPAALYVRLDDPSATVLAVVARDGIRLPNALLVAAAGTDHPFAGHRAGEPAGVDHGVLQVGAVGYRAVRWWTPRRLAGRADPQVVAGRREALRRRLDTVPPLEPPVAAAADGLQRALAERDEYSARLAADGLVGLGAGSTPAGDDVLAGVLVACSQLSGLLGTAAVEHLARRLGAHVRQRAAARTTALSATLLRHAARGDAAEPVVGVVAALAGQRPLDPALDTLLALGHTSGADTARGLLAGAGSLLGPVPTFRLRALKCADG